jgi:hypothetical protein
MMEGSESLRPSYEQLRDSATGQAGAAWISADAEEAKLRQLYRELEDDPRYTPEHKASLAWRAYDEAKDSITASRAKARDLLEEQARTAERQSLPFPDGEGPLTQDANKVLITQNESSRIVRRLDRLGDKGPFPSAETKLRMLREEYSKGLEIGGVHGGSICRGVLSAAEELGIDEHSVVDEFRKERHRQSYARAERSLQLASFIGKKADSLEPPFKPPDNRPRSLATLARAQRHW